MKAYQSLSYSWLVNSYGSDTTCSKCTYTQTHTHMHPYSHTHKTFRLPVPGLDVPAGRTAVSTLPLCLPVLLAFSVLRFHLWPSRRWRTLWQGDLGHLDGDGRREGTEFCQNCKGEGDREREKDLDCVSFQRAMQT